VEGAIGAAKIIIKETGESVRAGLNAWSENLEKNCDPACKGVEESGITGFSAVRSYTSLTSSVFSSEFSRWRRPWISH
jgi:hypothetical protein